MNKKLLFVLIFLLVVSFSTTAFASLTFISNAITGTTDSTIDLGAGNDLNLQTTGSNITIGTDTTLGSKLSIDASGSDITPLIIKTNGSVGNYTPANSGIFIKDAAGTEILRIFASDPDEFTHYNANNLYIGKEAGLNATTNNTDSGYFNTGIGSKVLYSNTTGTNNTAVGNNALYSNTTGIDNTANGDTSLFLNNGGSYNTANGFSALYSNTIGNNNTALGFGSMGFNTIGNNNSTIGFRSLLNNSTGSNNVALGYYAGAYETGSNSFYIDNQNRTNTAGDKAGALLYGQFNATPANQILTVNAKLGIGTTTPGSKLSIVGLPVYADNAAALGGGLVAGDVYRTGTGVLMVTY